jgi:hypothetical protein
MEPRALFFGVSIKFAYRFTHLILTYLFIFLWGSCLILSMKKLAEALLTFGKSKRK